jgi:hypothetical protein
MKVFIANLGEKNVHWPICQSESVLTLETSQNLFEFWQRNDRLGWIAWATKHERMVNGQLAIASVASRWFNLITTFHDTLGDVWVHRAGNYLFWTKSVGGPVTQDTINDPTGKSRPFLLLRRPTEPWRNKSQDGRYLIWNSIHPKAHHFLQTEATYQEVANDRRYKDYTLSLLEGHPLRELHEKPEWQIALGKKGTVTVYSSLEKTIYDAVMKIGKTVLHADGRLVETATKIKDLLVTDTEMREFLIRLYSDQQGLCALTGLPMLLIDDDDGPTDMRLSVDRIDSNGHYEPKNVQLVCRFANFWKSSGDNSRFKELIDIIRSSNAS